MISGLKDITAKALTLPIDERVILVQRLWNSIEGYANPKIEEEWLALAEKRWIEIEEGKVQCIPAEEAMIKARAFSSTKSKKIAFMF
jgi:putative addiction module component (TIGR02574 family)